MSVCQGECPEAHNLQPAEPHLGNRAATPKMSSGQSCSETVPIAIVGMGMRLPGGVSGPDDLIAFLSKKGDGVRDVPADRWDSDLHYYEDPSAPGKVYVKAGAFLESDVFAFDPLPFGISPREAEAMDPQQRLLLEVIPYLLDLLRWPEGSPFLRARFDFALSCKSHTNVMVRLSFWLAGPLRTKDPAQKLNVGHPQVTWEALENAGVAIDSVRGSNTGVFIGGFMLDSMSVQGQQENQKLISSHSAIGANATALSSRLSHTFDLRGPCMTIDTACSSSLVAVDLACKAIANGSCDSAIVGGVNVMLSPLSMIFMCKGGFLSPDGRCKAFDGSADGYGRGEGAAVVYLKRLDRAVEDGDRIFATVLASGVSLEP